MNKIENNINCLSWPYKYAYHMYVMNALISLAYLFTCLTVKGTLLLVTAIYYHLFSHSTPPPIQYSNE